jgi:hypothetical protein
MTNRPRPADRVLHHDGERLTAGDLTEGSAYESWLRALHVRAVHDTWGVAVGFALPMPLPTGIFVGPGVAYDACGHELVLTHPVILPLPDLRYVFDLVCSAGTDGGPGGSPSAVVCPAPLRRSPPAFRWVAGPDRSSIRPGADVVLGTYGPFEVPSLGRRDWAHAATRPRMSWGVVQGDQFDQWFGVSEKYPFTCPYTFLDTSSAGFGETPQYFVWLLDEPWTAAGKLPPVVSVFESMPRHVGFQFTFPLEEYDPNDTKALAARLAKIRLLWFGIESITAP